MHPDQSPRRSLKTAAAARYLGLSPSTLRKWRMVRPADPGEHGPEYIRVSSNIVLYELTALDRWLEDHAAAEAA